MAVPDVPSNSRMSNLTPDLAPNEKRADASRGALVAQVFVPSWERRTRQVAAAGSALIVGLAMLAWSALADPPTVWLAAPTAGLFGVAAYWLWTRDVRRRDRIRAQPFPVEWSVILDREVVFYRALGPDDQARFRRDLQLFLGEKQVTGIGFPLDETTRLLAGVSAVIPVFGFPEWEWHQISEVLVYPDRFNEHFEVDDGHRTLGMVGTGAMHRIMILSRPDLLQGFRNAADKRNVGLHEFAHLVDKSDGEIDGIPGVGLDRLTVGPWIELVRRKMDEMRAGDSDIQPYGLTNEAEFFAVVTEYFFERPDLMRRKHPELTTMLERVFKQDFGTLAGELLRVIRARPRKIGRNSPCPCGSGLKFKKCCLSRT